LIIYPALDLRGGKVVRLKQGDPARQTIYGDDPGAIADRWTAAGAAWLHVVNLDGALASAADARANLAVVKQLARRGTPIQFGGGLRSADDVRQAFDLGVRRVVIGTLAVEQPEIVAALLTRWGADAIAVALDSRGGKVTTHGWQTVAEMTPTALGLQMKQSGVRHALYTDVSRDGQLTGVNVKATVDLARSTGLEVIASGGVSTVEDIVALRDSGSVAGGVLGTALYEGFIDLAEALRLAEKAVEK